MLASLVTAAASAADDGFNLTGSLIPTDEIYAGGPPRDGIQALNDPELINVSAADFLDPDDRILGLELDGESRAYPIAILKWHESVNDRIGKHPFAATYCPAVRHRNRLRRLVPWPPARFRRLGAALQQSTNDEFG